MAKTRSVERGLIADLGRRSERINDGVASDRRSSLDVSYEIWPHVGVMDQGCILLNTRSISEARGVSISSFQASRGEMRGILALSR